MAERKGLDFDTLGEFEPRKRERDKSVDRPRDRQPLKEPEPSKDGWASREPAIERQLNVRLTVDDLERFKRICKEDRRTYGDMLRVLMDRWETG